MFMSSLAPGDVVAGDFVIEGEMGRGGMGIVYRARQRQLDRVVALKVLSPALAADEAFRTRFLREASIMASFDHPNIVTVYQGGDDGGTLFLAMSYIEGANLQAVLETRGPLDPDTAIAIAGEVAEALEAAHGRGLVHRDVKPANILIEGPVEGVAGHHAGTRVLLTDFGLARSMRASADLRNTFAYAGSPLYSAPEQLRGDEATPSADIFSLACVLHECLTGDQPFAGTNPFALAQGAVSTEGPRVSERVPGIPTGFDAVLARALSFDPAARYASCHEFVDALRSAQCGKGPAAHAPVSSRRAVPEHDVARPVPGAPPYGGRRALYAISAVILACAVGAALYLATRPSAQPRYISNSTTSSSTTVPPGTSSPGQDNVTALTSCASSQPSNGGIPGGGAGGASTTGSSSAPPPSDPGAPPGGGGPGVPIGQGTSDPYLGLVATNAFRSGAGIGAAVTSVLPRPDPLPPCLQPQDVVVDLAGTPIHDVSDLTHAVASHHAGDVISLTWEHTGSAGASAVEYDITVTLASKPSGATGDCTSGC